MIESLLILTLLGLLLSSTKKMGLGNPFQVYFFVWFLVFFGYYLARDTFMHVDPIFFLLLLGAKSLAFIILLVAYATAPKFQTVSIEGWGSVGKSRVLWVAQILVIIAMPLAYRKAVDLAGEDIFTVIGYVKLRGAFTEDGQSLGVLSYVSILSTVSMAIVFRAYFENVISIYRMFLSLGPCIFYTYLSTGRTFVLFLLILMVFPLVLSGKVRLKGIVLTGIVILALFVGVAAMTAKGISSESSVSENLGTFLFGLRGYTLAPLLAMARLVDASPPWQFGTNTFRLFFTILQALGLGGVPPSLIRDYTTVPDLTNVYTVYEVYFKDFSFVGIFIPPFFLIGHWWLYLRAKSGGIWVFYYAALLYPLIMQFFQDQYFSLLSMWIQVFFWFWVLLVPGRLLQERN